MTDRKWTKEIRILLYQNLVDRFGPCHTWESGILPSKSKKEEYLQFLKDFGKVLSILSGDETTGEAVQVQINFATTPQPKVKQTQTNVFILNMAAAYETGFIRARDFPVELIVEREKIIK